MSEKESTENASDKNDDANNNDMDKDIDDEYEEEYNPVNECAFWHVSHFFWLLYAWLASLLTWPCLTTFDVMNSTRINMMYQEK